jgi:hypothetical protein
MLAPHTVLQTKVMSACSNVHVPIHSFDVGMLSKILFFFESNGKNFAVIFIRRLKGKNKLSHPIFRRKPSAYLYAWQDQVSCI